MELLITTIKKYIGGGMYNLRYSDIFTVKLKFIMCININDIIWEWRNYQKVDI